MSAFSVENVKTEETPRIFHEGDFARSIDDVIDVIVTVT
jgi:hypothetical protein